MIKVRIVEPTKKGEKNSNIYARPSHQTSACQDCGKTTSTPSHLSQAGEHSVILFFQGAPVSPLEILFCSNTFSLFFLFRLEKKTNALFNEDTWTLPPNKPLSRFVRVENKILQVRVFRLELCLIFTPLFRRITRICVVEANVNANQLKFTVK